MPIRKKAQVRPSYPSVGRQLFGLALTLAFALAFDVARSYGLSPYFGNLYIPLFVFVTYWSGMRMGFIATLAIFAYALIAVHVPASSSYGQPNLESRLMIAAIFFGIIVTVTGLVQNKLSAAAVRTFDANAAAQRAEDELRRSEQLRSLVVDSAMDAIVAIDANGVITLWNPSAEKMFGWKSEEIVGRLLSKTIIPGEYRLVHDLALTRRQGNGIEPYLGERVEVTAVDKGGREFDIELSVVSGQNGDETMFVGFLRDVSAQKKLQRELVAAQRLDSIGQLAGGVAHDFNNVLSVIVGYAELAKIKAPLDAELQKALDEILLAARKSSEINGQLLAFARKQTMTPRTLSLNEIIDGVRPMFRTLIRENIDIWFSQDDDLWPVTVDPGRIEQLLTNLVINARDAMPNGGKLMIETRNVTVEPDAELPVPDLEPGDYATVSVSDTGVGIAPEIIDRIFEPFFTTKDEHGSGLGLASAYGIAAQARGHISVYSEVGHGSMFRVYLPRAAGRIESLDSKVERPAARRGSETVLVAEDNAQVRAVLVHALEHYGYKVLEADSGDHALEVAARYPERIDLLLTDLIMPRVGGSELAQRLREARPEIPVIFLSGYTEESVSVDGVEGIAGAFMQKPVMPTDLAAKVREVLDAAAVGSPRA